MNLVVVAADALVFVAAVVVAVVVAVRTHC